MPQWYEKLQEYRVILRHTFAAGSPAEQETSTPEFIAILNAVDEIGARIAADALVTTLKNYVTVVSITRI